MHISIFDLFSIGIGPSSSHTVGPMKAAYDFVSKLDAQNQLAQTCEIHIDLYGSLALTGEGHGTNSGILLGLAGEQPKSTDPDSVQLRFQHICQTKKLKLLDKHEINFDFTQHYIQHLDECLPKHSNGMRFTAFSADKSMLFEQTYYSIGGGFIVTDEQFGVEREEKSVPYPFDTADELMTHCQKNKLSIAELMLENEIVWQDKQTIQQRLLQIAKIMDNCIEKGCHSPGILPGGLNVKRRAPEIMEILKPLGKPTSHEVTDSMKWLNLYALAVNEENAAGGRVVTAPTNGAAGIIPAVMHYHQQFYQDACEQDIFTFLLTAGAIAILYKKRASISGAEVGCQGEVGVASSMAAAALTAVLGGTIKQIENAAEIAMEHSLGMTCDPIAGLVQIPCIERNAMGSVKAVNASRLALLGDGEHMIPLDKVIATMDQTGRDMMTIYKETSQGGLAVNLIEC